MANNDAHQTSDTEVILANTEPKSVLKENEDLDFVDDWINVNVTVEDEIWRGKRLREEKPIPDDTGYEYNFADIDFLGSFVNQCRERKSRHKSAISRPTSPKSKPLHPRPTTAASTYLPMNRILRTNTQRIKPKHSKKCSMRIAELAVPTKRQCIDTWRNKSNILPEFMVERLKQHVMDQRPIVKIPDAINCFQQRRPQASKTCSYRCPLSENENYEALKPSSHMDTRTLCIIFAQGVIKRLSKPLNLTLTPPLENLSSIVSKEITKIISKCNCAFMKNRQYKAIQRDVSNKITVWIAAILEDLTLKLLEEDLRVKKENEANAKFSAQFVTVMETIIKQEKIIKSTDLEEEEGPVLDFIDDVVDNVMNICKPLDSESETSDFSKGPIMEEEEGAITENTLTPIGSTDNNVTKLEQIFNIQEATQGLTKEPDDAPKDSNENLTNEDHFRKEIYNIINNITKESGVDISNSSEDGIETENNEQISPEADLEHNIQNNNTKESGDDISNSSEDGIETENNEQILLEADIEHNINEEDKDTDQIADNSQNIEEHHEKEEVIDNAEKNDLNVSEDFEILTEDSDDEKKSKIVMVSKTDLVNPDNLTEQIKTSTTKKPENNKHEQAKWIPENDKSNVVFAEPNNDLLSDADESWPAELGDKPLLKVSEIASKSISSLGKIIEHDEKQISPPEGAHVVDKGKMNDTKLQVEDIMEKINDKLNTQKQNTESQSNKPLTKASKETTTTGLKTAVTQVDPNILDGKGISKSVSSLGKITKNDEKQISPPEGAHVVDKGKPGDTKLQVGDIMEKINDTLSTQKQNIENQSNKPLTKPPKETATTDPKTGVTQVYPNTLDGKGIGKSVTSSGKITEYDEKQISPPEGAHVVDKGKTGDTKLQVEDVMEKINDILSTQKQNTESQANKPLIKASKETTTTVPKTGVIQVDPNTLDEKVIGKSITGPRIYDKPVDESSKKEKYKTDRRESDLVRKGTTSGRTEHDKIPSHKTQSQIDYGWKVYLKTAPSWVTSWGQGRGEPSEDSIPIQIKPAKVRESDIREWCKDLEKAFLNLEMWSQWISNTCKETIFLLNEKEYTCPGLAKRDTTNWIRLKRNIHKDAILWTKLYQRTETNFNRLKRKYTNVEFSSNKPTQSDQLVKKAIFDTMCEFENYSVELHKMIVAAEYCAICTCDKTKTR